MTETEYRQRSAAELRQIRDELDRLHHRAANASLHIGHTLPHWAARATAITDGMNWSRRALNEVADALAPPPPSTQALRPQHEEGDQK